METFSVLLALCAENSPVTSEFPSQRPVTQSFDVFFDLRLNKRWVNNREAGDLIRHHAHYDVTVMLQYSLVNTMAVGNLDPCIARLSAVMILIRQHNWTFVFHEKGFQQSV